MRIERLARAHSILGWLTFLAFLGSGFSLLRPDYHGGSEVVRALSRANHLYLLGAALLHLLAARAGGAPGKLRARLRGVGSLVLFGVPPVLLAAFVREPTQGLEDRPLTMLGLVLALIGTGLIALTTPKAHDPSA
ncbi:MAG: hypothetical protein ABW252_20010 [Polyangiales bacterium]